MAIAVAPEVILYVCSRCIPAAAKLPRQWKHEGAQVLVREVPCTGKMDGQYLMHALAGGARGISIIACPKGECRLAQGNYRAEVRIGTVRRLLDECGLEPQRAELVHFAADQGPEEFTQTLQAAAERICRLGPSPLRSEVALSPNMQPSP